MENRAWVEIDLDAIRHNYKIISEKSNGAKICPVIKDNAYGHGAVVLAKLYEELGASYFAVSNIDEAIQLRENGISLPILILGYTPIKEAINLNKYNITQTIYSLEYGKSLNKQGYKINCHLKIETGMNRIGFKDYKEMEEVCNLDNLSFEGIFTHFSDCLNDEYSAYQFDNFNKAINYLESKGITFKIKHCANSGTIFKHPFYHLDMVRPGIILYGLGGFDGLRQALSLKAKVIHIKEVKKGEAIGYDRTYFASKDTKVATVSIGYGDGYFRYNKGKNTIEINGKQANILGNICMDMCMVDVSDIDCKLYDEAIIYGDLDKIASNIDTIPYELICAINHRVPKKYK